MLIKESTLRRIIKEEARRVLREDTAVPSVPGTPGQTQFAGWEGLSKSMTSLSQQVAQAGMVTLAAKIKDLAAKGKGSISAPAALVAATATPDGTATEAAKREGLDQLAATLATLATGKVSTSYLGAATTLMGGAPTSNTVDQTFTPVLRGIMTMIKKSVGLGVVSIRSNLAAIAATAPPPAGSTAPAAAPAAPAAASAVATTPVKKLGNAYVYTAVAGDTISGIANKVYAPPVPLSQKSASIYDEIARASKIPTNNTLVIGQALNLPLTVGGEKHRLKGY